jgi:serralysin
MANIDILALDGTVLPTLNGVQILNVQNANNTGGNTAALGTIGPNLTTFNLVSALTGGLLTASGANANLKTIGLNGTTASDVNLTVQYVAGALAGTSDALALNLTGQLTAVSANANISTDLIVSGGSVGAGFETVNLNVASASRLGLLTVNDSGGNVTLTTLNITGAGAFRDYATLVFKTGVTGVINASTSTGGSTLIVGTQDISMTGGSGSDSLTFVTAGDYNANDTVRLGSGTNDVIVLADTAINTTTAALNALITASEAETVGFSAAATVDMDFLTQTLISVNSTTDVALTVQKLAATDTLVINTGTDTGADVTASGSLGFTTANVILAGTATGRVSMDVLNLTGNAIVNIASNGSNTATNTLASMNLSANSVVTVTGTQSFTVTAALDNTSVVINGSGLTGTALLTVVAGTAASSLVGGLNNDVLTGGVDADTIVGGAGADTINSGADTTAAGSSITGGLGADAINLQNVTTNAVTYGVNVTAAESYATAGQFDTIASADLVGAADSNVITLTTGLLSTTVTAATSVSIGVTAVTAGAYLVVAATAVLTATDQSITVYQDSNSNGIIDASDLRVDFTAAGTDTTAITIAGGKVVVTQLHA